MVFASLSEPGWRERPALAFPVLAIVAAGAAFFLLSSTLVAIRVAMERGQPALPSLRRGFWLAALHALGWMNFGALIALAGVRLSSIPLLVLPFIAFLGGREDMDQIRDAMRDALTGLPNRALFVDRAEQSIRRAVRTGGGGAILLLDLDGFKAVNDTLGHHAGDALLIEVAARLRTSVRANDTVARLGGDEFSLLLAEDSARRGSTEVARALIQALERPIEIDGTTCRISASIGAAWYPSDGTDVAALLELADRAMYADKRRRAR
jgi:diguanylate cyclase (GGDEF)-like protein